MSRRSINKTSAGEPSFFYLMMAGGCFQRAAKAVHPKASATLRDRGRDYLMKATKVTSVLEYEASQISLGLTNPDLEPGGRDRKKVQPSI